MKHKLLAASIISIGLFTFTNSKTNNQNVYAINYEVFNQGFRNKTANKYFKKWRNVVLTDKCVFEQDVADNFPALPFGDTDYSDIPDLLPDKTLKSGSRIQVKYYSGKWYARGNLLPNVKYHDWIFPENYNGSPNNYSLSKDNEFNGYNFVTPNSYIGVSTIFKHKRKVKVTKNVRADKLKLMYPAYKDHSVKHKTIKKGTILTVGAPSNHYSHQIWGKGLKNNSRYIWVINKLSGWYKIIK